jgi:uncharacterized protein
MNPAQRIVIDTNMLVSAAVFAGSLPRLALSNAFAKGRILASTSTLAELNDVLHRPKFDKAARLELREAFFLEYVQRCELISVNTVIQACRHPKDDKFLELAVDGRADLILTGDHDLLVLNPFRSITILTPTQYIELG